MTHPKYGQRFSCYQCGVKFFDLGKPKPLCPKCGADQKKAPKKASVRVKPVVSDDFEEVVDDEQLDEGVDVDELTMKGGDTEERFNPDRDHFSVEEMPEDDL
ncbi:MAG: FYDLN acid domain-containing protein [Nitrospinota bacterium]|nr:FYDLN acid domain-containing protein [Nitrospinota bacterium]